MYYQKWLKGEITCKMVRLRSGAGLQAKFFGKKVEEEEEQKMMQAVLEAEIKAGQVDDGGTEGLSGPKTLVGKTVDEGAEGENGTKPGISTAATSHASESESAGALRPPSPWPSYALVPCSQTIQLDSQGDSQQHEPVALGIAETMEDEEYNRYQLNFAIAAGDVPANPAESVSLPEGNSNNGGGSLVHEMSHEPMPSGTTGAVNSPDMENAAADVTPGAEAVEHAGVAAAVPRPWR